MNLETSLQGLEGARQEDHLTIEGLRSQLCDTRPGGRGPAFWECRVYPSPPPGGGTTAQMVAGLSHRQPATAI